ncbi:MAG: hypothetical protein LBL36_07935 [Clostridiales Family XIII bacterium]|jgi:hypothetical protein|nr:hypothetical protein [Clostridiales Family XIII bacterium]
MVSAVSLVFALIYLAIIAFVIVFLVKAVKYFKRQEVVLREISAKLDGLAGSVKPSDDGRD